MSFDDVVNGWAEIAAILSCSVRTAQRWTKAGRLSVYKLAGAKRPRVYAYRTEINTWRERSGVLWRAAPGPTESAPEAPPRVLRSNEHLWGWKTIAGFMDVSVRSVQRWEQEANLPIHRLKIRHRAVPYVLKGELSAWIKDRTVGRESASKIDMAHQRFPALLQRFLDASTAQIAVLDAAGTIIAVNKAWRIRGKAMGCRKPNFGIGANYFEVCSAATGMAAATACLIAHGLAELLAGKRRDLTVKYPCDSPTGNQIFLLRTIRFEDLASSFLVLMHSDVTNVL